MKIIYFLRFLIIVLFTIVLTEDNYSQQDNSIEYINYYTQEIKNCCKEKEKIIAEYEKKLINIETLSEELKKDSQNIKILITRGYAMQNVGLNQLAFDDFWKAYNLDSNNEEVLLYGASLFKEIINDSFVISGLERIYKRDTTKLELLYNIASLLYEYDHGRADKALSIYNIILSKDSLFVKAYIKIAELMKHEYDDEKNAMKYYKLGFEKLKKVDAYDSILIGRFCYNLGILYTGIDDKEAIKYLEEAINCKFPFSYGFIYRLYDKTGMIDKKNELMMKRKNELKYKCNCDLTDIDEIP